MNVIRTGISQHRPTSTPPRQTSSGPVGKKRQLREVSWRSPFMSGVKSRDKAARDLELAVKEAKTWIEEVTGRVLDESIRVALEDGTVLCELIQSIRPGSIKKINRRKTAIAHLDNLRQFLSACEVVGLKDSQLFDLTDLQEPGTLRSRSGGVKHTTADRRIRNVCITLYWLGRRVSEMSEYTGPQLNLEAFREILDIPNYSKGYEKPGQAGPVLRKTNQRQAFYLQGYNTGSSEETSAVPPSHHPAQSPRQRQAFYLQGYNTGSAEETSAAPPSHNPAQSPRQRQAFYLQGYDSGSAEETSAAPPSHNPAQSPRQRQAFYLQGYESTPSEPPPPPPRNIPMHNGGSDTDVTPDELLDKIQSTVDEMLSEFHPVTPTPSPQPSFPPPPPLPADPASQLQELERHIPEPPKKLSPPPPPPEVQEEEKEEEPMLDVADAGPVNGYRPEDEDPQSFPEPLFLTILMTTQNGSYGLQVIGGVDTALPAQVERVVPGRPAESSGVMPGDFIVSVNQTDVTTLTHFELVSIIKQCGAEGDMALGICRGISQGPLMDYQEDMEAQHPSPPPVSREDSQLLWEEEHIERERQRREVALMYMDSSPAEAALNTLPEERERGPFVVEEIVRVEEVMENEALAPQEEADEKRPVSGHSPTHLEDSGGSETDIFAPITGPTHTTSLLSEVLPTQSSVAAKSHSLNTHQEGKEESVVQETVVTRQEESPLQASTPVDTPSSSTPTARMITEDPLEMNGIKVRPVQRTRWTPNSRDSSVHHVDSPDTLKPAVVSDPRARTWNYRDSPVSSNSPAPPPPPPPQTMHPSLTLPAAGQKAKGINPKRQGPPSCSHCLALITRGPMMSIPERKLHFHARCLTCTVCRSPLSMSYGHTTVFLRQSLPHCASCYSTDSGLKATTC